MKALLHKAWEFARGHIAAGNQRRNAQEEESWLGI